MEDKKRSIRRRISKDDVIVKKVVQFLKSGEYTKDELTEHLGLKSKAQVTDSLLLKAVKFAGNSEFLKNLIVKRKNVVKERKVKNPTFSLKRGVVIPAQHFEGRQIVEGQQYDMKYGVRTGVITLRPIKI